MPSLNVMSLISEIRDWRVGVDLVSEYNVPEYMQAITQQLQGEMICILLQKLDYCSVKESYLNCLVTLIRRLMADSNDLLALQVTFG